MVCGFEKLTEVYKVHSNLLDFYSLFLAHFFQFHTSISCYFFFISYGIFHSF